MSSEANDKKRGLLIDIEHFDFTENNKKIEFESNDQFTCSTFEYKINDKDLDMNFLETNNKKMATQAKLMKQAYECLNIRESTRNTLFKSENILIQNYYLLSVLMGKNEGIELDFIRKIFGGIIRPDLIIIIKNCNSGLPLPDDIYKSEEFKSWSGLLGLLNEKNVKAINLKNNYYVDPKNKSGINTKCIDEIKKEIKDGIKNIKDHYERKKNELFEVNYYPKSIGEDLYL